MGLAWMMPSGDSTKGFFKFLPSNGESVEFRPSRSEIARLEKVLLEEKSDGTTPDTIASLIRIKEEQKDWILCQLPLCVKDGLNGSRHLRCPPTIVLISPQIIELVERLHTVRLLLLKKLEG